MSERSNLSPQSEPVMAHARNALRLVCIFLPHLAGLAQEVRIAPDQRIETAAIFASGRIILNPDWFGDLAPGDAAFVLAHELLHLALRSHQRSSGSDARLFNVAHDFIINDMLADDLGRGVPAGGGSWPDARHMSAEQLIRELQSDANPKAFESLDSWYSLRLGVPELDTAVGIALRAAGLARDETVRCAGVDVLSDDVEREWFPEIEATAAQVQRTRMTHAATRAVQLAAVRDQLARNFHPGPGASDSRETVLVNALRAGYLPSWELMLQSWLEAVAAGPRTYQRASRRAGERTDVVLPGRRREGWMLHIVLDTSGSMEAQLPRVLGAIAALCDGANVEAVRLLQCDSGVTSDELVAPERLAAFQVVGLGGSDLTPALNALAGDPEVEAAIVITDGEIAYPTTPPPYAVLWILTNNHLGFFPPYGRVLELDDRSG